MRPLGASSFRGSYWASYSLTWTAAEDCALILLPPFKQGQRKEKQMSTKTLFIAVAIVATVITGCESLDKGALASGGLAAASAADRGDRKAQTAVAVGATVATVAMASNRQPSQPMQDAERERNTPARATLADRSNTRPEQIGGAVIQTQAKQQAPAEMTQTSTEKKAEEVKAKPVNIAEISDDLEFVEALKKEVGKDKDKVWREKVFNRASNIKDQKLLLELIDLTTIPLT